MISTKRRQSFTTTRKLLLIVIPFFFAMCQKVYFKQLPEFEPKKTNNIAIFSDFLSIQGKDIYLERSKKLAAKMANRISEGLKKKAYILSPASFFFVGSYFGDEKRDVEREKSGTNLKPPFFIDERVMVAKDLKNILVSSFKLIDEDLMTVKRGSQEDSFLMDNKNRIGSYSRKLFSLGEKAEILAEFCGSEYLLFLHAQEMIMTPSEKLLLSLEVACFLGLGGFLAQSLNNNRKGMWYEPNPPNPVLVGGILAAVFFFVAELSYEDADTSLGAVLIDKNSGNAVWYGFLKRKSGGYAGDQVNKIADFLTQKFHTRF